MIAIFKKSRGNKLFCVLFLKDVFFLVIKILKSMLKLTFCIWKAGELQDCDTSYKQTCYRLSKRKAGFTDFRQNSFLHRFEEMYFFWRLLMKLVFFATIWRKLHFFCSFLDENDILTVFSVIIREKLSYFSRTFDWIAYFLQKRKIHAFSPDLSTKFAYLHWSFDKIHIFSKILTKFTVFLVPLSQTLSIKWFWRKLLFFFLWSFDRNNIPPQTFDKTFFVWSVNLFFPAILWRNALILIWFALVCAFHHIITPRIPIKILTNF